MDFLTPLAVGGLWLAYFLWQLTRRPAAAPARSLVRRRPFTCAKSMRKRPARNRRRSMPEEIIHDDGRIEHPEVRNEKTDANFRTILFIILGSMVVAAVILRRRPGSSSATGTGYEAEVEAVAVPAGARPPSERPPCRPESRVSNRSTAWREIERPNVYERQESQGGEARPLRPHRRGRLRSRSHRPGDARSVGQKAIAGPRGAAGRPAAGARTAWSMAASPTPAANSREKPR